MTQYLTDKKVSEITGRAVQSLRNDRCAGRGIPYIKLQKSVRYRLEDVISYMEQHKVRTEN